MHKQKKGKVSSEDESIHHHRHHHRHHIHNVQTSTDDGKSIRKEEADSDTKEKDDAASDLEPIPGKRHQAKESPCRKRTSESKQKKCSSDDDAESTPKKAAIHKKEPPPLKKKRVIEKSKNEGKGGEDGNGNGDSEPKERISWKKRPTGFLFPGAAVSGNPMGADIDKKNTTKQTCTTCVCDSKALEISGRNPLPVKRRFEHSLQTIVFFVDVVANGMTTYRKRLSFLCKIARVFPLAHKKIGNVLVADAERHGEELCEYMREFRIQHLSGVPRIKNSYDDAGPVADLQEMCFLKSSVPAARGVSHMIHSEPSAVDIRHACLDGDISTLNWLISAMTVRKNGKLVFSKWNRASCYLECCRSGCNAATEWAAEKLDVSEISKARHFFSCAGIYTADTITSVATSIGFNAFPPHSINLFCTTAIEHITAVECTTIMGKRGNAIEDIPEIFERKNEAALRILGLINADILGYQEYLAILKRLFDAGMAEAIDGKFPVLQRYAKKDARILDIAAKSHHVSSVKWTLSGNGLGWGDCETLTRIEKREMHLARNRAVYYACQSCRKSGIEVAKYLIKRGFAPNATKDKLRRLIVNIVADDEEDRIVANEVVRMFEPSKIVISKVIESLRGSRGYVQPTWLVWLNRLMDPNPKQGKQSKSDPTALGSRISVDTFKPHFGDSSDDGKSDENSNSDSDDNNIFRGTGLDELIELIE